MRKKLLMLAVIAMVLALFSGVTSGMLMLVGNKGGNGNGAKSPSPTVLVKEVMNSIDQKPMVINYIDRNSRKNVKVTICLNDISVINKDDGVVSINGTVVQISDGDMISLVDTINRRNHLLNSVKEFMEDNKGGNKNGNKN